MGRHHRDLCTADRYCQNLSFAVPFQDSNDVHDLISSVEVVHSRWSLSVVGLQPGTCTGLWCIYWGILKAKMVPALVPLPYVARFMIGLPAVDRVDSGQDLDLE